MIARALAAGGQDNRRRALVLSLASDIAYGVPGQRIAMAAEAIRCAEAAAPHANLSLHRAMINLADARATSAGGVDADLLDRAEQLERAASGIPLYQTADVCRAVWYRCVEDLDASRAALRRCAARAREAGEDMALWLFLHYAAQTEELAGDYASAEKALAEASTIASWYDDWPDSPWLMDPRCELLIAAGHLDQARRIADERLPDEAGQPFPVRFVGACIRGKANWWAGDAAAAVRDLEVAARCCDDFGWTDPGVRSRVDQLLAEAYAATGRPYKAAEIAARLRDLGDRMNRPALIGDACRIDALAAAADDAPGHLDNAAEAARAAVAAHERSPLRTELARSLLVLGRIERHRKDRVHSRSALHRARDLTATIGHRPLLAQINAEMPGSAPSCRASTLTAAEQRVAEQIAKGATNREAAAELFLSVRTVETHVASIYRKLGVRSRSDLRRALIAHTAQQPPSVRD